MLKSRRGRTTQKSPNFRASRTQLQPLFPQLVPVFQFSTDPDSKIRKLSAPETQISRISHNLPTNHLFRLDSSGFFSNSNRPRWRETPNQKHLKPPTTNIQNLSVSPKFAPLTRFSTISPTSETDPDCRRPKKKCPETLASRSLFRREGSFSRWPKIAYFDSFSTDLSPKFAFQSDPPLVFNLLFFSSFWSARIRDLRSLQSSNVIIWHFLAKAWNLCLFHKPRLFYYLKSTHFSLIKIPLSSDTSAVSGLSTLLFL